MQSIFVVTCALSILTIFVVFVFVTWFIRFLLSSSLSPLVQKPRIPQKSTKEKYTEGSPIDPINSIDSINSINSIDYYHGIGDIDEKEKRRILDTVGLDLTCKRSTGDIVAHGERCNIYHPLNEFCIGRNDKEKKKCFDKDAFSRVLNMDAILNDMHHEADMDAERIVNADKNEALENIGKAYDFLKEEIDIVVDIALRFDARGGSDVRDEKDMRYHYFTRNGVFEVVHGRARVDFFLVGGGGCGGRGGGGGGYTKTVRQKTVYPGVYEVIVGRGGVPSSAREDGESSLVRRRRYGREEGEDEGEEYEFPIVAEGGKGGGAKNDGGSGGGGMAWKDGGCSQYDVRAGDGGKDGREGERGHEDNPGGGEGQGRTTREFEEQDRTLYSGGGGGMHCWISGSGKGGEGGGGDGGASRLNGGHGKPNTGGGGGGARFSMPGYGGSGIVVVRYAMTW